MIYYISFSVSSHPYLLFSNKRDIRIYEVQDKPSSDLRRSKPRTTPAVKVYIIKEVFNLVTNTKK